MNWTDVQDGFSGLFEQGGMTLWAILFASILLWILIVERYWFHWRELPDIRARLLNDWRTGRQSVEDAMGLRRMEALVKDLRAEAGRNLLALNALTVILPLLGLLGTVSGMIKVFEVITVFGSGNTRGMASGISEALVTTMAGLFTALSGLYFVSDLESRADKVARHFQAELVEGG
ncbi:MAG: MotA/TolQ/ExbB proton channel family protein [Woeseia sp.]|nr:MotA/TolQ/ExbB proton channel family protein [Woeseia sp.]NNE60440.1 MotA/TolQ/ExbB proton channel family protein [Woeseia sp.]